MKILLMFSFSLGVKTIKEAERIWQDFFQITEVRDNVESLLQLEVEWDSFLKRLDDQMKMSDTVLSQCPTAQMLSSDTQLINVQTKKNVTLGQYLGKGENILLVLLRHFG